jgi:opacity protein-like surface antigen
MFRYVLAATAAVALMSTAAFAQVDTGTTTVITKPSYEGLAQKKVIIHRHDDGYGSSKRVIIRRHDDGYGSSMPDRTVIRRYDHGYGAYGNGYGGYGSTMPDRTVIHERSMGY